MKFSDFRKGDLVFSDGNKGRVWTVMETSAVGVRLLCTHFRDGDKVGEKMGKYSTCEPTSYDPIIAKYDYPKCFAHYVTQE